MLSCSCCRVPVPVPVPARTLPNLQVSHIPTYLPTGMQEPPQQGIIHSSTPSLPSSRLPAWYICMYLSVCASVYVRVSPCICPCACTYIQYPQKVHIKDTCTRVSWGMWLFFCLFKNIFADPIDTKNHPDERPCTRPVFHNFTR